MHIEEVESKLFEQRIDIQKRFHVKRIGVFGSFVQNKQTNQLLFEVCYPVCVFVRLPVHQLMYKSDPDG